jgi:hypothetical protein
MRIPKFPGCGAVAGYGGELYPPTETAQDHGVPPGVVSRVQ